jgi:hypothetical protein
MATFADPDGDCFQLLSPMQIQPQAVPAGWRRQIDWRCGERLSVPAMIAD